MLASFLFFCLLLVGCQDKPLRDHQLFEGQTMGTHYNITLVAEDGETLQLDREQLQAEIDRELEDINRIFSTYVPDSELMRFNRAPVGEWQTLSEPLLEVLRLSLRTSEQSDGAFDVTVGPLVNLWGFGPDGEPDSVPEQAIIDSILTRVGYRYLELNERDQARRAADIQVDLSAVAKGYGVDWLVSFLEQKGFANILVEIGGDLAVRGQSPRGDAWRLAIEQPSMLRSGARLVVELDGQGLVTSGEYRNYHVFEGQRYSHTIDPSTGYPVRHKLLSVTVIADTSAEADAWATAISALGEEQGMGLAEREQLPVYMILSEEEGFSERHSSAFESYR